MDTTNRTLASVISQSQQVQGQPSEGLQSQSFNTYLTVYSINLAHRFPDVSDLNHIDYTQVRGIAEFSAACANVGLEVWEGQSQIRQKLLRRSA